MDRDHLEYNLNQIRKRMGIPFRMSNEELAEEMFPYIQAAFPDALMVKQGIRQYIVVSKRARTALIKLLAADKAEYENYIVEIDKMLNQLRCWGN